MRFKNLKAFSQRTIYELLNSTYSATYTPPSNHSFDLCTCALRQLPFLPLDCVKETRPFSARSVQPQQTCFGVKAIQILFVKHVKSSPQNGMHILGLFQWMPVDLSVRRDWRELCICRGHKRQ